MIDDIEVSDITVPKFIVLQCSNEAVVDGGNDLYLQRLVGFIPDEKQEDIDLVLAV